MPGRARAFAAFLGTCLTAVAGEWEADTVEHGTSMDGRFGGPPPPDCLVHTDTHPLEWKVIQARLNETQTHPHGGIVRVWTNTTRSIRLGGRELTLEITGGSVALRRAASSPLAPRVDCELRSRFLSVLGGPPSGDVSGRWVEVSGFELYRGRAPHGGFLAFSSSASEVELRISDTVFVNGATTENRSKGCGGSPIRSACFRGGGAVSVDNASSLVIERVQARKCSATNAGGFLAARDVSTVEIKGVEVNGAESGTFGGAVSLCSIQGEFGGSWAANNVTLSSVRAKSPGGGVSFYARHDVRGSALWSVSAATISNASASGEGGCGGGGISFAAGRDVRGSALWSVSGASISGTRASGAHGNGGGISFCANGEVRGSTLWSVSDATICNASASGGEASGGGISFLAAKRVWEESMWSVARTSISDAVVSGHFSGNGASGGAISFWANNGVRGNASWSVSGATISNASVSGSRGDGGGIVYFAFKDVCGNASWSVSNTTICNASASGNEGGGGGISYYTWSGDVRGNASWSVSDTSISDARVSGIQTSGGAVAFLTWHGGVSGNALWSVSDASISKAVAGGSESNGGGISFYTKQGTSGNALWSVSGAFIANTSASGDGGGISFLAGDDVSEEARWSVLGSALVNTLAREDGGGVSFRAMKKLTSSATNHTAWHIAQTSITASHAGKSGGGVSLRSQEAVRAAFSIESLSCSTSSVEETGGCVAIQAQRSRLARGRITGLNASSVHALSGAVVSVVIPSRYSGSYSDTIEQSLTMAVNAITVGSARATDRGGVILVEVARPSPHRFRSWDVTCQTKAADCPSVRCNLPRYNSTDALPYAVKSQVIVDNVKAWNVTTGSSGQGALASLSNTVARFSNISAADIASGFAGGILAVFGASDVTLRGFCGRNMSAKEGVLLYSTGSGANITLDRVWLGHGQLCPLSSWLRLAGGQEESGAGSGIMNWIRSGTVAQAAASSVHLGCPLGSAVLNSSLGAFEQSYPSLPTEEQGLDASGWCELATEVKYSPRTFPYSSSRIGCERCPPGKYTLVRQGWVTGGSGSAGISTLLQPTVREAWTTCFACPTGANCAQGGKAVVPHPGQWGTTRADGGHSTLIHPFPTLLFDYACPTSALGCRTRYDSCNGRRTGMVCGACETGCGEALNTARCVEGGACLGSGLRVAAWVLLPVGIVALVVFYVATSSSSVSAGNCVASKPQHGTPNAPGSADASRDGFTNGLVTILATLFQLEWIVRSDDPERTSALAHASQFQLIPSWFGEPVCLWPGMGTVTKALLPAMLSFSLPLALVLVYVVHGRLAYSNWRVAYCVVGTMYPSRGKYKRAFVSLMVFAYGSLASVATKLVTPLEVASYGTRQALTGDAWAHQWYFWLGVTWFGLSALWAPLFFAWGMAQLRARTMGVDEFAWGMAFPVPVLAWRAVRRAIRGHSVRRSGESRKNAAQMFARLASPYRPERWGWDSVMMGRRLLFVLPSLVMWKTPVGRAFAYVLLTLVLFVVHEYQRPFRHALLNKVETASLSALSVLCVSNVLSAYRRSHGLAVDAPLDVVHQVAAWMLRAVASVSVCVVLLRARAPTLLERTGRQGIGGLSVQLSKLSRESGLDGLPPTRSGLSSPLLAEADERVGTP